MIVDCMVHTYRYPEHFNKEAMLASQPERRKNWSEERWKEMWDRPIEQYFEVADGVDKAILSGFSFPDTRAIDQPNEYLYQTANRYPDKLAWCCTVDPLVNGAAEEVERCVKMGAVGISEVSPTYGGYFVNDPRCYPVWAKAEELGIPVLLHAGPVQDTLPKARLIHGDVRLVDEVAMAFPKLKIVILHLGYYYYEDASYIVQTRENVFADISSLTFIVGRDKRAIPSFLPQVEFIYPHFLYPILYFLSQTIVGVTDKLIWSSDWPAASPRDSLPQIVNINEELKRYNLPQIPEQIIHNILHENWKKVFKLE